MIEVLWHGRGGQGAFTAARLLGAAASAEEGMYAMAFPSFGPERRGAPMRAFTKFSDGPIGDRSAIAKADFVAYLDETLFGDGWENELKPGGVVLVNSRRSFDDSRVISLDASGVSEAVLGRAIPNTVFLGAIAALCPQLSPAAAKDAVTQYMAPRLHEKNWAIIDEAVALVEKKLGVEDAGAAPALRRAEIISLPKEQLEDIPAVQSVADGSRAVAIPGAESSQAKEAEIEALPPIPGVRCKLRGDADGDAPSLDPAVFAKNTCYQAGHLVTKNAGWRNMRPVLDAAKCTMCLQCYLYCPDGTIFKVCDDAGQATALAIDYDFCKGCGVCARACRFGAIEMVDEAQALAAEVTVAASCTSAVTSGEASTSGPWSSTESKVEPTPTPVAAAAQESVGE